MLIVSPNTLGMSVSQLSQTTAVLVKAAVVLMRSWEQCMAVSDELLLH